MSPKEQESRFEARSPKLAIISKPRKPNAQQTLESMVLVFICILKLFRISVFEFRICSIRADETLIGFFFRGGWADRPIAAVFVGCDSHQTRFARAGSIQAETNRAKFSAVL